MKNLSSNLWEIVSNEYFEKINNNDNELVEYICSAQPWLVYNRVLVVLKKIDDYYLDTDEIVF